MKYKPILTNELIKEEENKLDLYLFDNIVNSGILDYSHLFESLIWKWTFKESDGSILILSDFENEGNLYYSLESIPICMSVDYGISPSVGRKIEVNKDYWTVKLNHESYSLTIDVVNINSELLKSNCIGKRYNNIIIDKFAESVRDIKLPFDNDYIVNTLLHMVDKSNEDKLTLIY